MVLKVGVIGFGYFGPNLVRNFVECERTHVVGVCDLDVTQLAKVNRLHKDVMVTTEYRVLLDKQDIDLIVIATPVSSHYELALAALQAGKHVLLEKPMTETAAEAEHLIKEAEQRGLKIAVDHICLFYPAVRYIKELIANNELGELFYYDSCRTNLGLFQKDVDVVWDLAVHDLAILDFILGETPTKVSCQMQSHFKNQPADIGYLTLNYASGFMAHINVNWIAPVKQRSAMLGGSKQMLVYDELDTEQKIKIYDKSAKLTTTDLGKRMEYHTGDMKVPYLKHQDALRTQVEHIADCFEYGHPLLSDANLGLRIVKLLELTKNTDQ